jgi:hypothetical protein
LVAIAGETAIGNMAGFTTESPSKRFVILAESGRCESLLQALETRTANGYRVVQCWGVKDGQGLLGGGAGAAMTYVLMERMG